MKRHLYPIDTLKQVQRQLAETLLETLQVKEHGSQERAQLKNSMYEAEQRVGKSNKGMRNHLSVHFYLIVIIDIRYR
ncbi:hypothetical protein ACEQPO_30795 [Bacillus sp. SL00103]